MSERESGYYWVRLPYECDSPEEIAYWSATSNLWRVFDGFRVPDCDMIVLDEQPITRSEVRHYE